ncbi:MAG: cytochrome c [Sneathiellaceae bacterium]
MTSTFSRLALAAGLAAGMAVAATAAAAETYRIEDQQAGKKAYNRFCAKCHGFNLKNPGTASFDLRKWPDGAHDRFVETVNKGKGDMPAWGDLLHPEEVEVIYIYIISHPDHKK